MGGIGSGGARTRSGPAPNPNALARQRDGKEWTKLPASGRLDPAPEWPDEALPPTPEELLLWRRLWTSPQALIWEADHVADLVALYCRVYLEAMVPRASALARTFTKQLGEQLYLSPPALAQGKYVIAQTAEAAAIDAAVAGVVRPKRTSARDRLNVVRPVPEPEDDDPETDVVDDGPSAAGEPPF